MLSTVVVSELLAHVHFSNRKKGYDPELAFMAILNRHFQILDVNDEVARVAGRLREITSLTTALHIWHSKLRML